MARPEPMNATPHHSKAKVSLFFSDPQFVAGQHVTGKMELECKAEKGMGINEIKAELFAIQELMSRDHSATSTFLHSTQYFQGPGLPPSNAVYPHPLPGLEPLPLDYYPARKGTTTFFFRFALPESSPSSIDFGKGLAKLKYEVRASVGVSWRNERQLVMERKEVDVVESPGEPSGDAEQVVIGENGKLWVQGRVLNSYVVAGESCCVELFVKNHSTKKNSNLTLTLSRHLHLPSLSTQSHTPNNKALQISDTLLTTPFRGADYIVHPGTEGIANLVFTVPKPCRGLRSDRLDNADPDDPRESESLFEVRCVVGVRLGMGLGSKDVMLEIPVTVVHPLAMKAYGLASPRAAPTPPSAPERYTSPAPAPYAHRAISPTPLPYPPQTPFSPQPAEPYSYPYPQYMSPPISPPPNSNNVYPWTSTPAPTHVAPIYPTHQVQAHIQAHDQQYYYYPPPPTAVPFTYPVRPSSADPFVAQQLPVLPNPHHYHNQGQNTSTLPAQFVPQVLDVPPEGEVGKGERASRISAHLRMTSRTRSVSPQSHRFPVVSSTAIDASPVDSKTGTLRNPALSIGIPAEREQDYADPHLLSASPRSNNNEVLSPRPILSPKHSFTIDRGTVKSDRVIDLERMAAAEVIAAEERNLKALPARPSSASTSTHENQEDLSASETPKLPPQPMLAPLSTIAHPRPRPEYWNRESGLEALERKLLEQVGTRKPAAEPERRADVRTVLPMPIDIPARNGPRVANDPPNDSAISSFALGTEVLNGSPPNYIANGRSSSPAPLLLGLENENGSTPAEKEKDKEGKEKDRTRARVKGREKKVHQLRKAATNRVAAWLGEIDPAVPPPACETPPSLTDSPRMPVVDIDTSPTERDRDLDRDRDQDPHPLLRSSSSSGPRPVEESHEIVGIEEPAIPIRSSGFVLHKAANTDSFDPPAGRDGAQNKSDTRGSTPTQQTHVDVDAQGQSPAPDEAIPSLTLSARPTNSPPPPIPMAEEAVPKPVLKRFAANWDRAPSPPSPTALAEAKYDVRSARGGRGGKVTSVASLWASLAAQNGSAVPVTIANTKVNAMVNANAKMNEKAALRTPLAKPVQKSTSAPSQRAVGVAQTRSSPTTRKYEPRDTNVADLTSRRAKMIKSASVPAVISSSLATPVLSSTASLARPLPSSSPTKPLATRLPAMTELSSDTQVQHTSTSKPTNTTTNAKGAELNFGQARLKELIKKYQQGQ